MSFTLTMLSSLMMFQQLNKETDPRGLSIFNPRPWPVTLREAKSDTRERNRRTVLYHGISPLKARLTSLPRMDEERESDDSSFAFHYQSNESSSSSRDTAQRRVDCIPLHEWQTSSFPTCNLVHEHDFSHGYVHNTTTLLGQGWFRDTWRVTIDEHESIVLKTLRLERDYTREFYELHRRDAVAMERLTHSPFVINVHGYCGQSVFNEIADFELNLENITKRMRAVQHDARTMLAKLQLAACIASGVAHVHAMDMVHYDLNPLNIAMTHHGIPKLNDFNVAEFLFANENHNETCGFVGRFHDPWWRSPEEMANSLTLNEKVDVYALGNILFYLLTTHSPWGKSDKSKARQACVRNNVMRGQPPVLPEEYQNSTSAGVLIFKNAMSKCFVLEPTKRGSAREVADSLTKGFIKLNRDLLNAATTQSGVTMVQPY